MRGAQLALRYAAFAGLATLANLGLQRAVLPAAGLPAAMLAGTVAGVAVKYELDRRWIFGGPGQVAARTAGNVTLYLTTAVVTTVLFWATEIAFWVLSRSDAMREFGAVIGLCAGYALKYRLDRRFVFPATPERSAA